MKTIVGPSKVKGLILIFMLSTVLLNIYSYKELKTYESIDVDVKKQAVVEYGSANYNLDELVDNVEGEIVAVKKDIDTTVVGKQEIVVQVVKDDIAKEIPLEIEVVDTTAPVIELKEEKITITEGEEINLQENINSVIDTIDGDLEYQQSDSVQGEDANNYYTMEADSDISTTGNHVITVTAVDKYGNKTQVNFELEVVKPVVVTVPVYQPTVYNNLPANVAGSSLVAIAYSLVGLPYVAGGNTPAGFDCSGFVQYVYSQVGISISRSSSTQMYDGQAVSYENAQPGDILSWGYNGRVSHSAIYVGNGLMIHATNPRQGVIVSDVQSWIRGSGLNIISVRRI